MFRWLKCPSIVYAVLVLIWETVIGKYCPYPQAGPWSVASFQDDIMSVFLLFSPCPKALHPYLRINWKPSCIKMCVPPYTPASISLPLTQTLSLSYTQTHTRLLIRVLYYAWKHAALRPTSFIIHQIWTCLSAFFWQQ